LYCSFSSLLNVLFCASYYYLHSPSTASGTRYRRSVCIDMDMLRLGQLLVATRTEFQHNAVYYATDRCRKRLEACINAEGGHLNTRCDTACLTFQLLHITTGSFQSHRWQPTTGCLLSLERLKERNTPSVRWNSFAIHKLVWGHSQVGWANGLQFIFFWDSVNNQKYVWIILLKMTFLDFPR